MLSIGTNTGAIMAQAAASSVTRDMETAMHRLSTGKRINAAADDAAGVAISSRLDSTVRGLNQSIRNALDAQALIDTAEGGMQETETILQRIRELSIQASNDTNSADDRANLNAEAQSLLTEIDRISSSTTWAGQSLLDGTFTDKSFQVGGGTMAADQLVTSIAGVNASGLGLDGTGISEVSLAKRINISDEAFSEIVALDHGGFAVLSETNSSSKTVFYDGNGDVLNSVETADTMGNGLWVSDEGLIVVNNLEHYNHSGVLVKTEIIAHEAMSMAENSSAMSIGTLPSNALTDNFFLVHNVGSLAIMNMSGVSQSLPISIDHTAAGLSNFSLDNDAEFNKRIQPLGDDKFLLIQTGNEATTSSPIGDTILGQVFSIESDANGLVSSLTELGNPFSIDRGETQDQNIDVQQINDDEFVLVYSAKSDTVTSTETQEGMNGQNVRAQLINLDDGLVGNYLRISSPTDTTGIENDETNPLVTKLTNGDIGVIWNGYGIYNDNGSYSYETYFQALRPQSFNILLTDNARSAITLVDTALQSLNSQRASLGAISNRLDHIVANNTNAATNVSKSLGRIQDADFAAESTSLAKNQILQQASTAMLAQANASKQNILELLQS
jgi:flagellin